MIERGGTDWERFVRAVENGDTATLTVMASNPNLVQRIPNWVELQLHLSPNTQTLECLLTQYAVSDDALSETLVRAARQNKIEMVQNLIERGAHDDARSQALVFAVVHKNADIARAIAPVSNYLFVLSAISAADTDAVQFVEQIMAEILRAQLHSQVDNQITLAHHSKAKKM